jgi:co-chaperonin GroES (HSP10)
MSKKLKALFNAVIVKPIETQETKFGNIIVPDLGEEKNKVAEVIEIGPGMFTVMGTLVKTVLKKGDIVILPTMGFTKFDFEGETYYIGKEQEILSKIIETK